MEITNNNYNTLPEQVQENKDNISALKKIITNPATVYNATVEIAQDAGVVSQAEVEEIVTTNKNAYIIDTVGNMFKIVAIENNNIYIQFTSSLRGPQGEQGEQGPAGTPGVSINPYPVNSIYLSVVDTNPAILFGGTWEQLKDKFLLGAGDIYENGEDGGSATHYHQTAIALADSGTASAVVLKNTPYNRGTTIAGSTSLRTTATGEDASFGNTKPTTTNDASNMPPYLVVYMWKRIA